MSFLLNYTCPTLFLPGTSNKTTIRNTKLKNAHDQTKTAYYNLTNSKCYYDCLNLYKKNGSSNFVELMLLFIYLKVNILTAHNFEMKKEN